MGGNNMNVKIISAIILLFIFTIPTYAADTPDTPKVDTPEMPKADMPEGPKVETPEMPKADMPESPMDTQKAPE